MDQINELVLREMATIIQRELPQFFVSISSVEVSRDLAHSKIWISEVMDTDAAAKELNREHIKLRKLLAAKIKLRKVPALHFLPDHSTEKASRIDKLLFDIKEDIKEDEGKDA